MICDALVVGAGPAGTLAALELARAGMRVVIADECDLRGPKLGESLPGVGLRMLRRLGIDHSGFGQVHRSIGGNLSCWAFDFLEADDFLCDPDGPSWRLSRRAFDALLLTSARSAGVRLVRSNVAQVVERNQRWESCARSGEVVVSRWLVEATGRSASVARQLGITRIRDQGLIALCGFGPARRGKTFDRTLIEAVADGWWYAAVLPEEMAVVALHVCPEAAQSIRRTWRQCLQHTVFVKEFFPPTDFSDRLLTRDAGGGRLQLFHGTNWIACGDAAMSFDPLSSQGIYAAMYSGVSAARAVIATEGGDSCALSDYARRLEEIRRTYMARLTFGYRSVKRWPNASFWQRRTTP